MTLKHFDDARADVRAALSSPEWETSADRLCAIWDLQGVLRLLARPRDDVDPESLRQQLTDRVGAQAGGFWGGDVWLWTGSGADRFVHEAAWTQARVLRPGRPEVRELDRHVSQEAWFRTALPEPWPLREQTPPILSFFSFKGGFGRSTAVASMAIQLARAGRRVVVVDLDLEAPGVGSLLAPQQGQSSYGVVDYLLERERYGADELELSDYTFLCDDPAIVGEGPPVTVMPAGAVGATYMDKLARVDYDRLADTDDDVALVELLKRIRAAYEPDYVLLDARAGFHDLGGLAVNGTAHLAVLFGRDSEQSWAGLEAVIRTLGQVRIDRDQPPQTCAVVFALAPDAAAPERPDALRAFTDRAYDIFSEHYYLAEADAPDDGTAVATDDTAVPAIDDLDSPHAPLVVGFDERLLRARSLAAVADRLTEGDFAQLCKELLARLGRLGP